MRRNRRRHDNRVDTVIRKQVFEAFCHARGRIALRDLGAPLLVNVAEPRELGELVEVPDEVRPPLA
jgi:hypothetical protein